MIRRRVAPTFVGLADVWGENRKAHPPDALTGSWGWAVASCFAEETPGRENGSGAGVTPRLSVGPSLPERKAPEGLPQLPSRALRNSAGTATEASASGVSPAARRSSRLPRRPARCGASGRADAARAAPATHQVPHWPAV